MHLQPLTTDPAIFDCLPPDFKAVPGSGFTSRSPSGCCVKDLPKAMQLLDSRIKDQFDSLERKLDLLLLPQTRSERSHGPSFAPELSHCPSFAPVDRQLSPVLEGARQEEHYATPPLSRPPSLLAAEVKDCRQAHSEFLTSPCDETSRARSVSNTHHSPRDHALDNEGDPKTKHHRRRSPSVVHRQKELGLRSLVSTQSKASSFSPLIHVLTNRTDRTGMITLSDSGAVDHVVDHVDTVVTDPSSSHHSDVSLRSKRASREGPRITPRQRYRYSVSKDIWLLMEDSDSTRCAYWLASMMPVLNAIAVVVAIVSTIKPNTSASDYLLVIETSLGALFTFEIIVRFAVCPLYSSFFSSFVNWVDIVAMCLEIVRVTLTYSTSEYQDCLDSMLCILPFLRLLKMLRRFPKFHLLTNAFSLTLEAMPVLLYTLSVIILSFSAVLYLIEPEDNIGSLTEAVWFVLVTMMTIGYGDVVPKTVLGEFVTGVLIICGALYMSMPLGIVGGSFSTVWEDRDRIMLMQCTRERLHEWGYTPNDIPDLFFAYDKDRSGELDLGEFFKMISEMQLGIAADRILQLFKVFDCDGSGSISDSEFVRTLFPKDYIKIFGADADEAEMSVKLQSDCGV